MEKRKETNKNQKTNEKRKKKTRTLDKEKGNEKRWGYVWKERNLEKGIDRKIRKRKEDTIEEKEEIKDEEEWMS